MTSTQCYYDMPSKLHILRLRLWFDVGLKLHRVELAIWTASSLLHVGFPGTGGLLYRHFKATQMEPHTVCICVRVYRVNG